MITKIILGVVGIEILLVIYFMLTPICGSSGMLAVCVYYFHPLFYITSLLLVSTVLGAVIYWVIKKIKQHKEAV